LAKEFSASVLRYCLFLMLNEVVLKLLNLALQAVLILCYGFCNTIIHFIITVFEKNGVKDCLNF